jgi:hypothetical protein
MVQQKIVQVRDHLQPKGFPGKAVLLLDKALGHPNESLQVRGWQNLCTVFTSKCYDIDSTDGPRCHFQHET